MSIGKRIQSADVRRSVEASTSSGSGPNAKLVSQLKLLSKAQTVLLQAYIHKKLQGWHALVSHAATLLEQTDATDQAKRLVSDLNALDLNEFDVDVHSASMPLAEELRALRLAINNGGDLPASGEISKTAEMTSELEMENLRLTDQIAELKRELALSKNSVVMPPAPPSHEEVSGVSKEQLNEALETIKARDDALEALRREVTALREGNNDSSSADLVALEEERKKNAELEARYSKAKKEYKSKLAAKQAELDEKIREIDELGTEVEKAMEEQAKETAAVRADLQTVKKKYTDLKIRFDKHKTNEDELKRKVASMTASTESLGVVIQKLRAANATLKKEYSAHRTEISNQLRNYSSSMKTSFQGSFLSKLQSMNQRVVEAEGKFARELLERKKLHNIIQELKGNIRVYMRCRPISRKELEIGGEDSLAVSFPNPGEVRVLNEKNRDKVWEFDEVFDFNTTQAQVYQEVSGLVVSVLDGYNVCIFAYGQTGSGKTFTMSGPPDNRGVNTRALEDLFSRSAERAADIRDTITVSLLEVYNEEIRDLLVEPGTSSERLDVKIGEFGNYVPGLTTVPVQRIEDVFQLMAVADRNRSSTCTNMNEHSSRSHMMLTVNVTSEIRATGVITRGKMNLVDLAGSERINKSGAQGQALKEAQNINKSLSALGDVIAARAAKQSHIPFRNSTLTYLLQDSLSQDSKTLMFVCISPVIYNAEETFCSLNFAARVRTVELGKVSKNVVPSKSGTSGTPARSGTKLVR